MARQFFHKLSIFEITRAIEPIAEEWRAVGWQVTEVDGHDVSALATALDRAPEGGRPRIVIAHTSILGRVRSIPPSVDPHWMKLEPVVKDALIAELKAAGA